MPVIDPQVVAIVALSAAALAVVLLVAVLVLALRLRRVRRTQRRAFGSGVVDVVELLDEQRSELGHLRDETERLHRHTTEVRELLRDSVSRVAVMRYDAFEDMGGALSFSAALLDEHGNGMVVSAINGRSETRCYAKSVTDGVSDQSLSEEEDEAVAAAMQGRAVAPVVRRRRRRAS